MAVLSVYRGENIIKTIEIDEKTVYTHKLMGAHVITVEVNTSTPLSLQIMDYIIFDGIHFIMNRLPTEIKHSSISFSYKIFFEGPIHTMKDRMFRSNDGLTEFACVGTPLDFVNYIVNNMLTIDTGWTAGLVTGNIAEKTIFFSNLNCRDALVKIAQEFKMEFQLIGSGGKSISLVTSVGNINNIVYFEYGRDGGMYKIERQQVADQNVVTRVYGFGSSLNITQAYRNNAKRLVFQERYLEKNTAVFGIKEGQYTNEDIYPSRTGVLTNVNMAYTGGVFDANNSFVEDTLINFDLWEHLLGDGMFPSIVFKTGDLAGVEFEIWKYDHATKRIYFNAYTDQAGYERPNTLNAPVVGNQYTLINMRMPQVYIDQAETDLREATQKYLDENSVPMIIYVVDLDPKYVREAMFSCIPGDRFFIYDSQMGVDTDIRVSEVSFPLVDINAIHLVVADSVPYTFEEKIIKDTITQTQVAVYIDRTNIELTRRNSMRQTQLKELIFDTDNYFDPVRIKPLSIETLYLAVGARSTDLQLNGVVVKPNYLGNRNRIVVTPGTLHHNKISNGDNYTWTIAGTLDNASLNDSTAYYLYAKCSRTVQTGIWEITTVQHTVEEVAGYYYFLIGVLYAVYENWRDYDFTYGMTYINGRVITTGRVRSVNGLNYFDLDQNQFKLGDANSQFDWNVTAANTLTIRGALVQSPSGVVSPIGVWRGAYVSTNRYYRGDTVSYGGASWIYVNVQSSIGNTPADNDYWDVSSAKATDGIDGDDGDDGANGNFVEYRYAKNGSSATPPSLSTTSVNPSGWSTTPPATGVLEYLWTTTAKKNYDGTALITNWTAPVRIKGDPGADGTGEDGADGKSPIGAFRGNYSPTATYHGNALMVSIVKYAGLYYIARVDAPGGEFSGIVPTNTTYWNTPSAQFESIATGLLLAEFAMIDNLGVRVFQGVPEAAAGDLNGTAANNVVANVTQIWDIYLSGNSGSVNINIGGVTHPVDFFVDISQTIAHFMQDWQSAYAGAGIALTSTSTYIRATGYILTAPSLQTLSGNLIGSASLIRAGVKRVDTITLNTGSSGVAMIIIDGKMMPVTFRNDYATTAQDFVNANAATYLTGNVVLTRSGNAIVATSQFEGLNFSGNTSINNSPNQYKGAVSIERNHIWEDTIDNDLDGTILINQKGYQGGSTRYRSCVIFNGRGAPIATFRGLSGYANGVITLYGQQVFIPNMQVGFTGLGSGALYKDASGIVRIVP